MGNHHEKTIYGKKTPAEVRAAIQSICEELDYDPFRELVTMATSKLKTTIDGREVEVPYLDADQRIAVAKEIASFIAPKPKSVEVKHEGNVGFQFIVTHFKEGETVALPASVQSGARKHIAATSGQEPIEIGSDERQ